MVLLRVQSGCGVEYETQPGLKLASFLVLAMILGGIASGIELESMEVVPEYDGTQFLAVS